MKSYCKGLTIDRDLVRSAYDAWLTKPSGRKNGWRVADEYGSADGLIDEIVWEITMRTLEFRPIHRYLRREPTNGKERVIGVESVKQQVCDYVAIVAMEPLLKAKEGFYQTASSKGKGQRLCRGALRRWSKESRYHVKADVRQCYNTISCDVVMGVLRRYVRSSDVLYLCETLMATYDGGHLEIGSYFSMRMAALVLSFAYHHVEGLGKVRRGRWVSLVRHQIWHMDDFVLMGTSKRDLRVAMRSLVAFLRDGFGLELKGWKVARTSRVEPLDLGGWVVCEMGGARKAGSAATHTRVRLRAGIFLRGTRSFARFGKRPSIALARRCASYWGWFKHGDCEGVRRERGIDRRMAHARSVVSHAERRVAIATYRQDEGRPYGTHTVCHAAAGGAG